ncbi:predicted protein [Histoplasma capsulatum G186AR]|uniref:Uncharacterized protein n=1 Tax=Ajellomyces capsulatus (strain G186AR / H82 / ATCC MYA-2454 / RMSCC 2432) TaxID=447093 RepID=C0NBG2_AJECG|nr:uncharacterized protein HCBG_00458 [Histoplasma capsulatum G186AR]EEH11003.1 predicted protein [Histoplasma capsulatum G186AR]
MYDGETLQATKRHRNKKDKRRHNVVGDRAAKAGTPGAALKSLERKNKLKAFDPSLSHGLSIFMCSQMQKVLDPSSFVKSARSERVIGAFQGQQRSSALHIDPENAYARKIVVSI